MKTAVVTGANRGLGLEFTKELLRGGYRVFGTYRKLNEVPKKDDQSLTPIHLDLANEASVIKAAKEIREKTVSVDLLINNAGIYSDKDGLNQLDSHTTLDMFQVNALGPLQFTRELLPLLQKGEGKVLAVSSIMGSIGAESTSAVYPYSMSKAALDQGFHALAKSDPNGKNLKILIVHPGWLKTDMGGPNATDDPAETARKVLAILKSDNYESGSFVSADGKPLPW